MLNHDRPHWRSWRWRRCTVTMVVLFDYADDVADDEVNDDDEEDAPTTLAMLNI